MSELFKSKVGGLVAGIHLLMVFTGLLYINLIDNQNVIVVLALMILTFPWLFFLAVLSVKLGLGPGDLEPHKLDLVFSAEIVVGALINAVILYLLGFLLTKAFNYFSSKRNI